MPLFLAVFFASLAGSTHCAGMCGAFLAFAVGGGNPGVRGHAMLNTAYNLGRLCTYTLLGAVAGAAGSAIDFGGDLLGVRRGAMIVAGALMIVFGVIAALRATGVRIARVPLPPHLVRVVGAGHRAVAEWPPLRRALSIGLLTTLLPCGWLYAFAITAAGTGDWRIGAATMAAFWMGTLPVMAALGAGLGAAAGPLRRRLPVLTSLLMVAVGVWTIAGRVALPTFAPAESRVVKTTNTTITLPEKAPCCDGE